MKQTILILLAGLMAMILACQQPQEETSKAMAMYEKKLMPSNYWDLVRSYPEPTVDLKAYHAALKEVQELRNSGNRVDGLESDWEPQGPGNIGGRINSIAVEEDNPDVVYVASARGGVFRTEDDGQTWEPLFDDQLFLSAADIEINPQNPNSIFVGTGDASISSNHYIGDGIYRSTDRGQTWQQLGLEQHGIVSRIEVHPMDTNIIYATTTGRPQTVNEDRGVYKSEDAGATWEQVLLVSDSTTINDLVIHPENPEIAYVSSWQRVRTLFTNISSGQYSRIFKTVDGGDNWEMIHNGLPEGDLGRIGLYMDRTNYDRIITQIVGDDNNTKGIYITEDAGASWDSIPAIREFRNFDWYFAKIRINPYDPSEIFVLAVDLWKTNNLGESWTMAAPEWNEYQVHADKHDLVFIDEETMILATDGGLYKTSDGGLSWDDYENIQNTQFYHCKVNPHDGTYWGGAQDNGTTKGNDDSPNEWPRIYGGDGFDILFHPENPDIFYVETQWGNVNVTQNGGINFSWFDAGFDTDDVTNWNTPIAMSQHNPNILYKGSYRMWRFEDEISTWVPISEDLTDPVKIYERAHVLSDIAESSFDASVLICGTADGNVHRTLDYGETWESITEGLPDRYVKDVEISEHDPQTLFVTHSGYRFDEYDPLIHMSNDMGNTWMDITGNLPSVGVNDIEQHPSMENMLVVATDGGVFITQDMGQQWDYVGETMPIVNVTDVEFDCRNSKILAATYARSMWTIDISELAPVALEIEPDYEVCEGESVSLNASTEANTISWSGPNLSCTDCPNPMVNPESSTEYTVTACNGDCACITATTTVTVSPGLDIPEISLWEGETLFTNDDADDFQWFLDGDTIPDAISAQYDPLEPGSYNLAMTNNDICGIVYSNVVDVFPVGETVLDHFQISVFPNPVSDLLHLEYDSDFGSKASLQIYSMEGRKLIDQELLKVVDLSALSEGLYQLVILKDNRQVYQKEIVKQ